MFTESVCCLQQSADGLVDAAAQAREGCACMQDSQQIYPVYTSQLTPEQVLLWLAGVTTATAERMSVVTAGYRWTVLEKTLMDQRLTSVLLFSGRLTMCWDCNRVGIVDREGAMHHCKTSDRRILPVRSLP